MKNFLRWIRTHSFFKIVIVFLVSLSLIIYTGWYFFPLKEGIGSYTQSVDKAFITQLFKDNWYWLVAGEGDFSTAYVNNILDNKTPSHDIKERGNLNIFVYHKDKVPVGFTAFYKKSFYKGFILFLAVDEKYRGKGYARKLLTYAIDQLKSMGSSVVELVTRTDNTKAISLYKSMGFEETWRNNNYVRFQKKVD